MRSVADPGPVKFLKASVQTIGHSAARARTNVPAMKYASLLPTVNP